MQRSFELAPRHVGAPRGGVDVSMERTDRGGSGTVAETMFVLGLWVLIVAGWWLRWFTDRDGECGGRWGVEGKGGRGTARADVWLRPGAIGNQRDNVGLEG